MRKLAGFQVKLPAPLAHLESRTRRTAFCLVAVWSHQRLARTHHPVVSSVKIVSHQRYLQLQKRAHFSTGSSDYSAAGIPTLIVDFPAQAVSKYMRWNASSGQY